jgi:Mn2+/Fe2+ NRAMP family transporter
MQKLGPGLLFAASAVGVSHLVQSTRAGADFGLSMGALILLVCLVKYPAFRFGAEYAAIARESLLDGYARLGNWLLVLFLVAIAVEGFAVIPAVSLVAAGLTVNVIGIPADEIGVTIVIVLLASLALIVGRYRLLEQVSRVFVAVFAALTVIATIAALGLIGETGSISAPITPTRENLFFSVAVAGWMPVGMGGAVMLSLWVLAKSTLIGRPVTTREALFDFNLGYAATTVLALCFLLMGTALLFGRGVAVAESSVGFGAQLVGLFTNSVGAWIRPVIGAAALAVMFSTVITVVDGFPRLYANVVRRLLSARTGEIGEARLYVGFIVAQALAGSLMLWLFVTSFGTFIDFATTAGFIVAPVVAFLNHRVMLSAAVRADDRAIGIVALTIASVTYLYFRFV